MAIKVHVEHLNGGLVTSRDPSLLKQGELVRCNEATYRPNSMGLRKVGGKSEALVLGAASGINGVRYVAFDGASDRVLITYGAGMWQIPASGAAAVSVTGGRSGKGLEAVHYENKYFLANGTDTQHIFNSATAIAPFGLTPEPDALTVTLIASSHASAVTAWNIETWNGGPYPYPQPYYWLTEYASAYDMETKAIKVTRSGGFFTSQNSNVIVELPVGATNPNATERRIYRSTTWMSAKEWRGLVGVSDPAPTPVSAIVSSAGIPLIGTLVTAFGVATTAFVDHGLTRAVPYPLITVETAGTVGFFHRDDTPPTWDIGDIFEDSLVCNDVADKSNVKYSFSTKPWSFPSVYFINFETKQADVVTYIKTLGNVCVVGMKNQIWRLNYLPRETDSEFNRGRCRERLSDGHGIMSRQSATTFTMEGTAPRLAFVSRSGVQMTDGYRVIELTRDLAWSTTVNTDLLTQAILQDVPHLWSLVLYYTPAGGTNNTRALYFSYHPQHLKEGGRLKVSGPATVTDWTGSTHVGRARAIDSTYGNFTHWMAANMSSTAAAAASAGQLVKEDQNPINTPAMDIKTRMMYLDDIDSDVEVQRGYLLSNETSASFTDSIRAISRKADNTSERVSDYKAVTAGRLERFALPFHAEALQLQVTGNNELIYVGVKYDSHKTP